MKILLCALEALLLTAAASTATLFVAFMAALVIAPVEEGLLFALACPLAFSSAIGLAACALYIRQERNETNARTVQHAH